MDAGPAIAIAVGLGLIYLGFLFGLSGTADPNVLATARFFAFSGGLFGALIAIAGALGSRRTTDMQNLGLFIWAGFLLVDYPNDLDMRTYWRSLANGDIPRNGRRYVGMGGLIGIHGTDKEELNRAGIDWTLGCVSLATRDARELYAMVPEGTLVYIAD